MPLSASYRWMGDGELDLAVLSRSLEAEGLTVRSDERTRGRLVLKGGSRLRVRLLRGYFIDPEQLPIGVELLARPIGDTGRSILELDVHDRLGIAVRDESLHGLFERAAANVREVVATRLEAMGDFEAASGTRSDRRGSRFRTVERTLPSH